MDALTAVQGSAEQLHETQVRIPNSEVVFEMETALLKIAMAHGFISPPKSNTDSCPF